MFEVNTESFQYFAVGHTKGIQFKKDIFKVEFPKELIQAKRCDHQAELCLNGVCKHSCCAKILLAVFKFYNTEDICKERSLW